MTSLSSIGRMAEMGAAVPADMAAELEAAGDAESVRRAGTELATSLCQDLLDAGAPGLHFYTLNRSLATREIYANLGLAAPSGRRRVRHAHACLRPARHRLPVAGVQPLPGCGGRRHQRRRLRRAGRRRPHARAARRGVALDRRAHRTADPTGPTSWSRPKWWDERGTFRMQSWRPWSRGPIATSSSPCWSPTA